MVMWSSTSSAAVFIMDNATAADVRVGMGGDSVDGRQVVVQHRPYLKAPWGLMSMH